MNDEKPTFYVVEIGIGGMGSTQTKLIRNPDKTIPTFKTREAASDFINRRGWRQGVWPRECRRLTKNHVIQ